LQYIDVLDLITAYYQSQAIKEDKLLAVGSVLGQTGCSGYKVFVTTEASWETLFFLDIKINFCYGQATKHA